MSIVTNFATSGFFDYKNVIIPIAAGLPLALEGASLAKSIYQNPARFKEIFCHAKKSVRQFFTIQSNKPRTDEILRIAKNILILLSCLTLMGTAAYFSAVLLPGTLAITGAISAAFLIGKLFLNAKSYKKRWVESFTPIAGEDPISAKHRIRKNIAKAVLIALFIIGTIGIGAYISVPMMAHGFSWSVPLPFQTKGVVFAEYAAIGALNGAIARYKWKNGDRAGALFHLFVGALSFLFPAYYWNREMRLHHSFYGLMMMSAPSRPIQLLGSAITFDSSLYMLAPLRGYSSIDANGFSKFHQYDFINSIVDQSSLFAGTYAGSLMLASLKKQYKAADSS